MLANYPKRTDLWHLYIDKETKRSNIDSARRLLERMICTKLSVKNMKSTFKKYLKVRFVTMRGRFQLTSLLLVIQFEETNGDKSSVDQVKQKAREYVMSLSA